MFLKHKGINVFYSEKGSGKPVILLHGFLENSSMWNDLATQLSKEHQVISIDLLGHGQTECLGYIHSMELMAEAVNAVLIHLKIEKATFVGHSMGGYVALAFAEKYSTKIEGLCLMNSTAQADNKERKLNRDRAIKVVKENYKAFVSMSIANLFAPENRDKLLNDILQIKNEALKTPLQGIVAALEGMKIRKDRTKLFKTLPFKKLLIIGLKDPVLDANSLKNHLQGSDVKIIEFSGGHMSHIENKEEFTYKILHFIEK